MNEELEERINSNLMSMIKISAEYVNWNNKEISNIYIFCSTVEGVYFSFFNLINKEIVQRHKVNEYLNLKCDISKQGAALEVGINDLEEIIITFNKLEKKIPALIKLTYDFNSEKYNIDFDYEDFLTKSDLTEEDLEEKWMEELKKRL